MTTQLISRQVKNIAKDGGKSLSNLQSRDAVVNTNRDQREQCAKCFIVYFYEAIVAL